MAEWPPIGKIAAHSAYEMFSWYKYLIVSLVFSHLGFWSGSLFLIAPFPDLCLLVPFEKHLSLCVRKPTIWVPTWSDTNRAVQSQKMVRGWKFLI